MPFGFYEASCQTSKMCTDWSSSLLILLTSPLLVLSKLVWSCLKYSYIHYCQSISSYVHISLVQTACFGYILHNVHWLEIKSSKLLFNQKRLEFSFLTRPQSRPGSPPDFISHVSIPLSHVKKHNTQSFWITVFRYLLFHLRVSGIQLLS